MLTWTFALSERERWAADLVGAYLSSSSSSCEFPTVEEEEEEEAVGGDETGNELFPFAVL